MRFEEFLKEEDPAYAIFDKCIDIVFEGSDGNTEIVDRISNEAKVVYLLCSFEGEIYNGGFDQFFFNSISDHSAEILNCLGIVGANKTKKLLEEAVSWFPNSMPSPDREERWKQLEEVENHEKYESEVDWLDTQFYKNEDNLSELINDYVKNNTEAQIVA